MPTDLSNAIAFMDGYVRYAIGPRRLASLENFRSRVHNGHLDPDVNNHQITFEW